MGSVIAVPTINLITTIMAAIHFEKRKVMSENFFPPRPKFNTSWSLDCNRCSIHFAASTLEITFIVTAIQLMCLNIYYVSLSLIVSPIYTLFSLVYYIICVACLIYFITNFLQTLYMKCYSKAFLIFLIGLSITVLSFVLNAALMEMMVQVGDYENSGGILSIVGSLARSIVLSVLGYIGRRALPCFNNISMGARGIRRKRPQQQ